MFKIESYVTPILLSYVDKYVRDFKPADAQVSLWGGGVALHNLVLKPDVLQQEVSLPFTLISGRIHELLIQVPWTKIMSEPIVVTIDTIECVLSLNPPSAADETPQSETSSQRRQVVEAPPGYMQALVRRVVSNISLRVHHLIVKYVQDDIVLSLNVKHLAVDSADAKWVPAFADIDQVRPLIRRLVKLDDFTLCLDRADSDGKIRFYQEPILYRCQLELRVLSRLVSATIRRATNISIQLSSSRLAWGITNEQLTLLVRLLKEKPSVLVPTPTPAKTPTNGVNIPSVSNSFDSAEPTRSGSWSEWAWSWMPHISAPNLEEAPSTPTPIPINFSAKLDKVSLLLKIMETESTNRKRTRAIMELSVSYVAARGYVCSPCTLRIRFGARELAVQSRGKCVCKLNDVCSATDQQTIYIAKDQSAEEKPWTWPVEEFQEPEIDVAEEAEEAPMTCDDALIREAIEKADLSPGPSPEPEPKDRLINSDVLWSKMDPLIYLDYVHERRPPSPSQNPYENTPKDFEYSDWVEECSLRVVLNPISVLIRACFIHRLAALSKHLSNWSTMPESEQSLRVLTIEECDALQDNLPQRRIVAEIKGLKFLVDPYDTSDKHVAQLLILLPESIVKLTTPLYPYRVCEAACQMLHDSGPLWTGARAHLTLSATSVNMSVVSSVASRPCGRVDIRAVAHILLNKHMFSSRERIFLEYSLRIKEANLCGSAARLMTAYYILMSLLTQRVSQPLRYTSVGKDALLDEELVALDLSLEDLIVRGYRTKNTNTHMLTLQSVRVTALHSPSEGCVKQAWVFSGPDAPCLSQYVRIAMQWCDEPTEASMEYLGIWAEQTAFCVDPLFIRWLAYKPALLPLPEPSLHGLPRTMSSAQYFLRRRTTPPSSSGRGASQSGAELVHVRSSKSVESSSEPSEKKSIATSTSKVATSSWLDSDRLIELHNRLRRLLFNVDLGLIMAYTTMTTASAVDVASVRDAMERHAMNSQEVLAMSFGRFTLYSTVIRKFTWQDVRHDGPTLLESKDTTPVIDEEDSFPWKLRFADVSCYTLEIRAGAERSSKEKSTGLRSQLKFTHIVLPRTILDLVTTTLTLSVVTKQIKVRTVKRPEKKKHAEFDLNEAKARYFTSGLSFKPSSLREFLRGPATRTTKPRKKVEEKIERAPSSIYMPGPIISFGVNVHADTPPIVLRLDQDQVAIVSTTLHCFNHIITLLKRPSVLPRHLSSSGSKTNIRLSAEMEEEHSPSEESKSEPSEFISIYESQPNYVEEFKMKTFLWCQWVISRVNMYVATPEVKLAFEIDDIISSVDIQSQYNQLKVKIASATVRHYEKFDSDEWQAGVLGGRILEARDPSNTVEESHFMAVTITQAQISNLPESWKEELNPKVLQNNSDSMWEIYVTLAPLEALLQPMVLDNIKTLIHEIHPESFCPLASEAVARSSSWQWPYCYITAGGLRLLLAREDVSESTGDDTFMFSIGKLTVSPHPENPICRRPITSVDSTYTSTTEGRQYDVMLNNVSVKSAQLMQLVNEEATEMKGTGGDNPALMWTKPTVNPKITPLLHAIDIGCVLAPSCFQGGQLLYGPALEVNLVSDCTFEVGLSQLRLAMDIAGCVIGSFESSLDLIVSREDPVKQGVCPYAMILMKPTADHTMQREGSFSNIDEAILEEPIRCKGPVRMSADSGVDTVTSNSTLLSHRLEETKRGVVFVDNRPKTSDYLEIYVTMGTISVCVYVTDDGSDEVTQLLPPPSNSNDTETMPAGAPPSKDTEFTPGVTLVVKDSRPSTSKGEMNNSVSGSKSIIDSVRNTDAGQSKLEDTASESRESLTLARKFAGNVSLIQLTLHQPNLYYWQKKTQKTLQVSLFNAWLGLGPGPSDNQWHLSLFSTAQGIADPQTDIPPALCSMKYSIPGNGVNHHVSIRVDVERPIMLQVCMDRLRRLRGITELIERAMYLNLNQKQQEEIKYSQTPTLCKWRRHLAQTQIESIIINTSQISVIGSEGCIGWDSSHWQISHGQRPERIGLKGAVTALMLAVGPTGDCRQLILQPLLFGVDVEAAWEAWRRGDGPLLKMEPRIKIRIDLDKFTLDLRPEDMSVALEIQKVLEVFLAEGYKEAPFKKPLSKASVRAESPRNGMIFSDADSRSDHFYKDDLRSGAFKIVSGGQLPMAYQVVLDENCVSWKYPHPRTITRIVAFPLPGFDTETQVVLELYDSLLERWEVFTHFCIPVAEPREINLHVASPEAVFAMIWRFRTCQSDKHDPKPFHFDFDRFLPDIEKKFKKSTLAPEKAKAKTADPLSVSAEQLSATLRIDSYFSPGDLPRISAGLSMVALDLRVHCAHNALLRTSKSMEGYYVSKPLMRDHPILCVMLSDSLLTTQHVCNVGDSVAIKTNIQADLMECSSGLMQPLLGEFTVQVAVSNGERTRLRSSQLHLKVDVARIQTLKKLADHWRKEYYNRANSYHLYMGSKVTSRRVKDTLDGLISLWIYNSCCSAIRVGQEGTDELICLSPSVRRAYRWQNPNQRKMIRLAIAMPPADWCWSESIPFTPGTFRVRIEAPNNPETAEYVPSPVYIHVKVDEHGSRRTMKIAGGVALANMLRHVVLFKIRKQSPDELHCRTITSGELEAEAIGPSVVTGGENDMVLKIKFASHETVWSGDIPLRECTKENVPWLVKVPSAGDIEYVSVWCRVNRAKSDGRVIATLWPLYVLTSYLPLDVDVKILTQPQKKDSSIQSTSDMDAEETWDSVQSAPGKGHSIHLTTPGTTAARHYLSFKYTDLGYSITQDVVPLYYGVTETSVFDKRAQPSCIDDVILQLQDWLERSRLDALSSWPYSVVKDQFNGLWVPTQMQPKSDVMIRYQPVIVCGGCSLEVQVCPTVLLCNASPVTLTLRAHDAAPICRVDPGTVVSPPSTMLQKPFFISIEVGRETFVSSQLEICTKDPGRYGTPPPGQLVLDRSVDIAIQCNQKVALLSLFYELKEDMNVLGVASTYMIINKLEADVLVCAIAVPHNMEDVKLNTTEFKRVSPTPEGELGLPLPKFRLRDRWRGSDPSELRVYICLALGNPDTCVTVPVRLARDRRMPIALKDESGKSLAVVVEQCTSHGSRHVIVSPDPCPQLVVVNNSSTPLCVAQPDHTDDPSTSAIRTIPECAGALWHVCASPGESVHYSTPAYIARYPPDNQKQSEPTITFLTFALQTELPLWCQSIAVADGEQLLQLAGGRTLKIKILTHPHSTLVELNDVDKRDISASDIRKRLVDPFASQDSFAIAPETMSTMQSLARTFAEEKLMQSQNSNPETLSSSFPEASTSHKKTSFSTRECYPLDENASLKTISSVHSGQSIMFSEGAERQDEKDRQSASIFVGQEMFTCLLDGICVEVASACEDKPLLALHLARVAARVGSVSMKTNAVLTISDIQIDNLQYETDQYDFSVVMTSKFSPPTDQWPSMWNMFGEHWTMRETIARLVLKTCHDQWTVAGNNYKELTEVTIKAGPLFLYIEDAFVASVAKLIRLAVPSNDAHTQDKVAVPLRLRLFSIEPIDLHLTLHTSARMYIALDQSPLHLGAFHLRDMMTSPDRLSHALTVHYLSAAILGAGWVVGGLELLGAPGALAARVGGATGGVKGVASTAAAALLRSLSTWAGSLARNLDLLAGDEEHTKRTAAARRRPPPSFVAGLTVGITNLAINILGAVGGLAHHPLVGVAVGETEGGAAGLRRGLLGALTKPLSATADLVAYAGHGLLTQTGWDPAPQPRPRIESQLKEAGWRRDCVRWTFKLASLTIIDGFSVQLDGMKLVLLVSHKVLVMADPETERVVEMIDFRHCSIEPCDGDCIVVNVKQKRQPRVVESADENEDEYQINAAAMARVARYTGAEASTSVTTFSETRPLRLKPQPSHTHALYALLTTIIHNNSNTHFSLL